MLLSLTEASLRLGMSQRQVRYLIGQGKIEAVKKDTGRWLIDEAKLPLSETQRQRQAEKAEDVRTAVEEALAPHVRAEGTWSVTSVRAFQDAVEAWRAARTLLGEHAAVQRLESTTLALAREAHAYSGVAKCAAFIEARNHAAEAVAWLHMEAGEGALGIAAKVEGDVIPGLSGLIRRNERSRR